MQYRDLQDKWRGRLEEGTAGHNFDLDRLAPERFYVFLHDYGSSGTCCSDVQAVGVFDGPKDFLSFLRFAEIPRVLDFHSGTNRDVPLVVDAYILGLEVELRNKVDWVLGLVDRSLRGDTISAPELRRIFEKFNEAFDSTNPTVQILAWGSLVDILTSSALEEAIEEAVAEEEGDNDRPCTQLKALLATRGFSGHDKGHLTMARGFLEQALSF